MAATIIIYAGAIVVTFLFVIMLAQQRAMPTPTSVRASRCWPPSPASSCLGACSTSCTPATAPPKSTHLIERTRDSRFAATVEEMAQVIGDPPDPAVDGFFADFKKAICWTGRATPRRPASCATTCRTNVLPDWVAATPTANPVLAKKALERLEQIGLRARAA